MASKRQVDSHKLVISWVLEQIRNGKLTVGQWYTIKQLAEDGKFTFASVRKAMDELGRRGVVKAVRSRGAQIIGPESSPDWRGRGRLIVGVLTPPSARMAPTVIEGVYDVLRSKAGELSLANPSVASLWLVGDSGTERAGEEEVRRWSQFLDGLIALPCSTDAEVTQAREAIARLKVPCIPMETPSQHLSGVSGLNINAAESGRLAATHLLEQLRSFRRADAQMPPVYVFSEHPVQQYAETVKGCESALLEDRDLFWRASEYLRHPGDAKTLRWFPGKAAETVENPAGPEAALWKPPVLFGESAGRFFAEDLIEAEKLKKDAAKGQSPRCGVICLSAAVAKGALESFEHASIRVGADVMVLAVDQIGQNFGSFLTRVRTDYRALGRLAMEQLLCRLLPGRPEPTAAVAPILQRRRSTNHFLHKLWRSNPGVAVIRDLDSKFLYGNPSFEESAARLSSYFRGKDPIECWGEPTGQVLLEYDRITLAPETRGPHVSCEWLPYFRSSGLCRFTFRFPIDRPGRPSCIGTLGFDFKPGAIPGLKKPTNPSSEQSDSRDDPEDDLIEAFFRCLPCSVIVRQGTDTCLYSNQLFQILSGQREGAMSEILSKHFAGKEAPPANSIFVDVDTLPDCLESSCVVRFPLLDGFYDKIADGSIGFDQQVLKCVNSMLEGVDTSRAFGGKIARLTRRESVPREYVVEEADLPPRSA